MNRIEVTIFEELQLAVKRRGGQAEFAAAIGVGQAYLSQIINGRRPIARLPFETVAKISKTSGIPFERLAEFDAPLAPEQYERSET